jgi:hypothetical protein
VLHSLCPPALPTSSESEFLYNHRADGANPADPMRELAVVSDETQEAHQIVDNLVDYTTDSRSGASQHTDQAATTNHAVSSSDLDGNRYKPARFSLLKPIPMKENPFSVTGRSFTPNPNPSGNPPQFFIACYNNKSVLSNTNIHKF